jgi:LysM repeat protein
MPKRLNFIFRFLFFATLISCKAYKPVVPTTGAVLSEGDYIERYKGLAVSEMKRTGIPASITLAQGIIESDYGRSTLAREANNHFGIKCHNDWKGPTVRHNDDKRNECFRKYRNPEESYSDHSDFLKSGSRYASLFSIDHTDYKGWARGLKKAGYATNPDYANMLIRKIEENNLWYLDSGKKDSPSPQQTTTAVTDSIPVPIQIAEKSEPAITVSDDFSPVAAHVSRIMETNRIQYIVVREGDSKEKIEQEHQLLKWEIARYNELADDFKLVPGQILYLQPKREKAEPGKETHIALEGETMYLISQKYGIKLKSLYEKNRLEEGTEPEPGKTIWLRNIKPVSLP